MAERGADEQERGTGLMVIGLGLIVAALLVFFFYPAGARVGYERPFTWLITGLAAVGLLLIVRGRRVRRQGLK